MADFFGCSRRMLNSFRGRSRTCSADCSSVPIELERFALLLAWLVVIAIFGAVAPDSFLTWPNFSTIFGSQAVLVILTLGLIVPLTAGDIDLSVAQVLTLSSEHQHVQPSGYPDPLGEPRFRSPALSARTRAIVPPRPTRSDRIDHPLSQLRRLWRSMSRHLNTS
jgi:hypothetical protein